MDKFFNGYTIGIEILKHERQNYSKKGEGNTIYVKIFNQTLKKIDIKIKQIYKINTENAQFEKDYWLNGFNIEDSSINSGVYKTAGAIFLNSVGGNINKNCKTGIIVEDKTNGLLYDALFVLNEKNRWSFVQCDVKEEDKIPDISTIEKKLKNSIERLELFEEKLGVRLDNLSVKIDDKYKIKVLGEIFSTDESLNQNIFLNVNLYNHDGDLINTRKLFFNKEKFMGYDTFEFLFLEENIAVETSKMRIYVKII
jgi:hypothetical protein